MRVRLAFQRAVDERFLVTCESLRGSNSHGQGTFSIEAFEDENDFLEQVVLAELSREDTVSIVSAVLLTVARAIPAPDWVNLRVTPEQFWKLGFKMDAISRRTPPLESLMDLHGILMQTPTPFVLLMGPEHRIVFGNAPYAQLIRRTSVDSVMGKPIRQALPELRGQPYFALLDEVYRTGKEYVGRAVPIIFRNDRSGRLEQHYLDFIYCPVRNPNGEVCGIMAQANDVTDIVMDRNVRESRENQLYKQWAELDMLYRYSPLALSLIEAKEYRILRLNDLAAELLGGTSEDFVGKVLPDVLPASEGLRALYDRVAAGEVVHNEEMTFELPPGSGRLRTWLITCNPLCDANGHVETISSVSVEITDRVELATSGKGGRGGHSEVD